MAKFKIDSEYRPSGDQPTAIKGICDALNDGVDAVTLLGVTGSGKTEVYLQSIAHTLEQGRSAIVLVPEISLTPQTVRRFRARFGNLLAVLHSRLTDAERREEWQKIYTGQAKIAIGARSALFAPLANLGLIVVDEEHENSYKQSEAPRYSARDVAVMRGKLENAAVLLGSATPSLESYYNALNGKYRLWTLNNRAEDSPLPEVRVVDLALARAKAAGNNEKSSSLFTPELVNAVRERLRLKEQIILFLNRRGFSRELGCPEEDCTCRKPGVGMWESLRDTHGLKAASCAMVGDKPEDLRFGINAGLAAAVLVLTGKGMKSAEKLGLDVEAVSRAGFLPVPAENIPAEWFAGVAAPVRLFVAVDTAAAVDGLMAL